MVLITVQSPKLTKARNCSGQLLSFGHRAAETHFPLHLPRKELLIPTATLETSAWRNTTPGHTPSGLTFILPQTKSRGQRRALLETPQCPIPWGHSLQQLLDNGLALSGMAAPAPPAGISQKTGLRVRVVHVTPVREQWRKSWQFVFQAWPKLSC